MRHINLAAALAAALIGFAVTSHANETKNSNSLTLPTSINGMSAVMQTEATRLYRCRHSLNDKCISPTVYVIAQPNKIGKTSKDFDFSDDEKIKSNGDYRFKIVRKQNFSCARFPGLNGFFYEGQYVGKDSVQLEYTYVIHSLDVIFVAVLYQQGATKEDFLSTARAIERDMYGIKEMTEYNVEMLP